MSEQLILLKEIQDIDLRRDKLLSRKGSLPHVKKINDLKRKFAELKKVYGLKKTQLEDEMSRQKKLEGELEILTEKIDEEDRKLYGGSIKNPKELVDIQKEIGSLKRKKDDFELNLLEIMEKIEDLKASKEDLSGLLERAKEENDKEMLEYKQAVSEIDEELKMESGRYDELILRLEDDVYSLYKLLKNKDGLAVAVLKNGICQGCHVELPAEEVDRILSTDNLWRCPNCERILSCK
ncbi:MAG TPA: hypothetical protein ENN38_00965 [Actinobacteria bacterium]|nr:hypothetical protein [Actinomycetota bacterium]